MKSDDDTARSEEPAPAQNGDGGNGKVRPHQKRKKNKRKVDVAQKRRKADRERKDGNGQGKDKPGTNVVSTPKPNDADRETIEKRALFIWAAMVSEHILASMSKLFDELIADSPFLDDDDEEKGEDDWVDGHRRREAALLEEGIDYGFEKYPDFNAINLGRDKIPADITSARAAADNIILSPEQLAAELVKYPAMGETKFEDKFPREQLHRMVRRDLKARIKAKPKYTEHVRNAVPGSDVKYYGSKRCTSTKGTFAKGELYEDGGGLDMLLSGGWLRVAKDRIDPEAWSHEHGPHRKTERKNWRYRFIITEQDGRQSPLEIPREKLTANGQPAIKLLAKAGVHIVHRDIAIKFLVRFLRFKPKHEIVRMPRAGWAEVGGNLIFVRPDEVITPPGMPKAKDTTYVLDSASRHGLHVAGTTVTATAEWMAEIAAPLRGNSNVALAFATFFAAPLLRFANEPGGGVHLYGPNTIGKTLIGALGQSIYGWPHEMADGAFGVSWGGTEAGFDALAQARTDLGLPLDEITLSDRHTAEQVVYKLASGTKGPRAVSTGGLRDAAHASLLVLSTGEKSLAQFVPNLQEGARKRLVDVPAQVQPGTRLRDSLT